MIVFFDLGGGVGRDSDELGGFLGGGVVGLAERLHEKFEGEADERIQRAEAGVLDVFVIHLPVVLSRDVAVTEVSLRAKAFGFGAGDGDDEVVIGEVEAGEIELAEGAEEFAEGGGENLEPAGADVGVVEPVNSLFLVLGGVDGGVGIHVMKLEEDFFGAAGGSEPVAGERDARSGGLGGHCYFAPFRVKTARAVRARMRRSSQRDQFWM